MLAKLPAASIPTQMMAAVLHGPNDLALEQRAVPEPGPGEVVLKIEGNTLCGTDGRIPMGEKTQGLKPGIIPGHEFGGTVVVVGDDVEGCSVGDRSAVYPIVSCGECGPCQAGKDDLCKKGELFGYAIDGELAE